MKRIILSISFLALAILPVSWPAKADVTLRYSNGQLGLVFRDNTLVIFKLCAPGTSVATRDCLSTQGEKSMGLLGYATAIQKLMGAADPDFHGVEALSRLRSELAFLEPRTTDSSLSLEEVTNAQTRLFELKELELKLVKAEAVLNYLDAGRDITYGSTFSDLFDKIAAPFRGEASHRLPDRAFMDPFSGLISVNIGKMCWWDAAGRRRERTCGGPIMRGCKLLLGPAWDLPSFEQLSSIFAAGYAYSGSMWLNDERAVAVRFYPNLGRLNEEYSGYHYESDTNTVCVAAASAVEPEGDIDGDGIVNRLDHCNQLPVDLTAPIYRSGPYLGCAGGQIPNN